MVKKKKRKIAIIGAGPIGLEAAVAAIEYGYAANVFERGEVGDAVRRWGHVRMFSPLGMNVSMRGVERLRHGGNRLPDPDAILTGTEYVAEYLIPLSYTLGEAVHTNVEVMAIGRCEIMKRELIGSAERMDSSFRLLLRRGSREWTEQADYVFDCTGTYATPNHLGDGGMPAVGESANRSLITYGVPDVLGRLRWLFENRRVLVVGSGHSAATSIRDLASLRGNASETEIVWATRRSTSPPYQRLENDPLPERDQLVREANELADSGDVDFRRDSTVLALGQTKEGLKVTLANYVGTDAVYVDRIIAAVGFRPDLEMTRELQTRTCYATESAFNLAPAVLGESGGDAMTAPASGAEKLLHPEPGYFSLGMKSYGRSPDFLIRTGREQIESVLNWMEKNAV